MDLAAKILQLIKLPPKLVLSLNLVCAFLLFAPSNWKVKLSLDSISKEYSQLIGIGFVLFAILLCIESVVYVGKKRKIAKLKNKYYQRMQDKMFNLDTHEKSVLREFYIQGQHTIKMPIDNPIVSGLLELGVLTRVGEIGRFIPGGMTFPVRVSDDAKIYLSPNLINWPEEEPVQAIKDWLLQNRPSFAAQLERRDRRCN